MMYCYYESNIFLLNKAIYCKTADLSEKGVKMITMNMLIQQSVGFKHVPAV